MGNLSPEGPATEGWRAPSASYENDGTFPQRVAQGQGLSAWELGSKIVHTVSPESGQDKSQGRADRGCVPACEQNIDPPGTPRS